MRRTVLLAVLVLGGFHCASFRQKYVSNSCPGNGTPGSAPIVCISATLQPNPEPVHVKRGHWVHFFFDNGTDDLQIIAVEGGLDALSHEHGHAWGRARLDAEVGRRYKYTIIDLTTGKHNDPEVMIDP